MQTMNKLIHNLFLSEMCITQTVERIMGSILVLHRLGYRDSHLSSNLTGTGIAFDYH